MISYIKQFLKFMFNIFKPVFILIYSIDLRLIRTFVYNISQNKELILAKTDKETFLVYANNCVISRHLYITQKPTDFDKLLSLINHYKLELKIDVLVDVGANIGTICIPACKRDIVSKAIAIEPDPKNYHLLKANVELNCLSKQIISHNFALGPDKDQTLELHLSDSNYGDNRIYYEKSNIKNSSQIISVKSTRLDIITDALNPEKTLIWMDVQGYEAYVLLGSEKTLKKGFPMVLEFAPRLMETHNSYFKLKEKLIQNNYREFIDLSINENIKIPLNDKNLDDLYDLYYSKNSFTDIFVIKL